MVPQSVVDHDREQGHISTIATNGVQRAWRRMYGRNWERAWRNDVGPSVQTVLLAAQEAAVAASSTYVAATLDGQGIKSKVSTKVNVDAFVGVAGDGRPVESASYGAVMTAVRSLYGPALSGMAPNQAADAALDMAGTWLDAFATTTVADTGRAAEVTASAQRPWVTGYVRMVEAKACSRCVVLAGKFFLYNQGFLRHPRCRCRHIPASENTSHDMRTNPDDYFDNLSAADQDRTFTPAGAQAIRMGANVSQVVNARQGMRLAQVYGKKTLVTTEGTTARGLAGKRLGELGKVAGERYRRSRTPRLMPETILAHAKSPTDAKRLLTRFGYILA